MGRVKGDGERVPYLGSLLPTSRQEASWAKPAVVALVGFLWALLALAAHPAAALYNATEPIVIHPNGTVTPTGAPLSTNDGVRYVLTDDIRVPGDGVGILINKSNVVLEGNGYKILGDGDYPLPRSGIEVGSLLSNIVIRGVVVENISQPLSDYYAGIVVNGSTSGVIIEDSTFIRSSVAVYSYNGEAGKIQNVTLRGNVFWGLTYALESYIALGDSLGDITVSNNTLEDAYIRVFTNSRSDGIVVENNTLRGRGYIEIFLGGGSTAYVVNNTLRDMEYHYMRNFIDVTRLRDATDVVYIANNTITNTSTHYAINVGGSAWGRVYIVNNTLTGVEKGIRIQGLRVHLENNTVESTGYWGLEISSDLVNPLDLRDIIGTLTLAGQNTVNGAPVLYYRDQANLVLDGVRAHMVILWNASGLTLRNMEFTNTYSPIVAFDVSNMVVRNISIDVAHGGMYLRNASNVLIEDTNITNLVGPQSWGLRLFDESSQVTIRNVRVEANNAEAGALVLGGGSVQNPLHKNLVVEDNILGNGRSGIELGLGIHNLTISNNLFRNLSDAGIVSLTGSKDPNLISVVNISGNLFAESNMGIHILTMDADEIYIRNNTFQHIGDTGGYYEAMPPVDSNDGVGIVEEDMGGTSTRVAVIENNTFKDSLHGIKTVGLLTTQPGTLGLIGSNTFENLTGTAITVVDSYVPEVRGFVETYEPGAIVDNTMVDVSVGIHVGKSYTGSDYINPLTIRNNTIEANIVGIRVFLDPDIPVESIEEIVLAENKVDVQRGNLVVFEISPELVYREKFIVELTNQFNGRAPLVTANVTGLVIDDSYSMVWLVNSSNVVIRGWDRAVNSVPFIELVDSEDILIEDMSLHRDIEGVTAISLLNANNTLIRDSAFTISGTFVTIYADLLRNITIRNNTFTYTGTIGDTDLFIDPPVAVGLGQPSGQVTQATIVNNTFTGLPLGVYALVLDAHIANNTFNGVESAMDVTIAPGAARESVIENNTINSTAWGIILSGAPNVHTLVRDNFVYSGPQGEALTLYKDNTTVVHNLLSGYRGAYITASNVTFVNNTFYATTIQAEIADPLLDIAFNDTQRGNYWRDYSGTDADGDGIGDTPHLVSTVDTTEFYDHLPLVEETFPIPPWLRSIVEGAVYEPEIAVSPTALDFGDVGVGDTRRLSITVSNTGNATLTLTDAYIDGGGGAFKPQFTTPIDIAPGESRDLEVSFTPPSNETYTAALVIESNDPQNPTTSVALTGTGIEVQEEPTGDVTFNATEVQEVVIEKLVKAMEGKKAGMETLVKALPEDVELPPNATLSDLKKVQIDALLREKPVTPETREHDVNGDGVIDILDTIETMRKHGVYRTTPPDIGGEAAKELLQALQKLYGQELEEFPTVEGKLWLIALVKKSE